MSNNRIRLKPDELEIIKQYRGIKNATDEADVNDEDVKHGWLKTDKASLFFKNPNFKTEVEQAIEKVDFTKIFSKVKKLDFTPNFITPLCLFDKLVFTDTHIGMDASDKGRSLYDLKWNKEIVLERLSTMIQFTLDNRKSDVLEILDLGDFFDGQDGQTTRGGHGLPQNMSNQECFDLGFEFYLTLIHSTALNYKKVKIRIITNDNHSGDMSYFLASAVKNYCAAAYNNVEIIIQKKFIDYELIGKRCFVTTHGKDTHNMKFGFKPKLDPNQEKKIIGYLNANDLLNKGYEIIFEKGDSHQYLFDNSTSDLFCYLNYPAFSTSSNWVATNFQKGKSGFIHYNYFEGRKSLNEYLF